jgi:2-polyprenyl-3-methyl-5-hydroxy-6-metoxy-1,4-benzoquinol methylase
MDMKNHWERLYATKDPTRVSWYQPDPALSFELITQVAPSKAARIIDVGGGTSVLVDRLVEAGYTNLTVLDLSTAALDIARRRLGRQSSMVEWLEADVLEAKLKGPYDVWHDRAVFHFLTGSEDRQRYVKQVARAVGDGGHVIVATFSDDGPVKCSGLNVMRHEPGSLHAEFGEGFELLRSHREEHTTPGGATQSFVYCLCRTTGLLGDSAVEKGTPCR